MPGKIVPFTDWAFLLPEERKILDDALDRAIEMRDEARRRHRSVLPAARVGLAGVMAAHRLSGLTGDDLLEKMLNEVEHVSYSWELTARQRRMLENDQVREAQKQAPSKRAK